MLIEAFPEDIRDICVRDLLYMRCRRQAVKARRIHRYRVRNAALHHPRKPSGMVEGKSQVETTNFQLISATKSLQ